MPAKFQVENDYTLHVVTDMATTGGLKSSLTRIFNFKSAQVTTIFREFFYEGRQYGGNGFYSSPTSSLTSQMNIQNFSDLTSLDEVQLMRSKLIELGAKPPELKVQTTLLKTRKIGA